MSKKAFIISISVVVLLVIVSVVIALSVYYTVSVDVKSLVESALSTDSTAILYDGSTGEEIEVDSASVKKIISDLLDGIKFKNRPQHRRKGYLFLLACADKSISVIGDIITVNGKCFSANPAIATSLLDKIYETIR